MLKIDSLQYIILKSNNPIDCIDNFVDIFLKLENIEKKEVIAFLAKNKSIDREFYPLFISKVYQNDKESLNLINTYIIVDTYTNFKDFYYNFLKLLCLSDYDFTLFKNHFDNIDYKNAKEFINKTFEYVIFFNNMKDNIKNF